MKVGTLFGFVGESVLTFQKVHPMFPYVWKDFAMISVESFGFNLWQADSLY